MDCVECCIGGWFVCVLDVLAWFVGDFGGCCVLFGVSVIVAGPPGNALVVSVDLVAISFGSSPARIGELEKVTSLLVFVLDAFCLLCC